MELRPAYPVRSARLLLRPLSEQDATALVSYRSLPEVCRYVPFGPMDEAAVRERLGGAWSSRTIDAEGGLIVLGAERLDSGALVGDVMLRWGSAIHLSGEIGYVFHPNHGGKGYATEAVHRVLHLAFDDLGLRRVVARLDAENVASARLAARLGMRQEAHLVENEWFKGRWSDELDFALLAREWGALHDRAAVHAGCPVASR
jgi:RimJ/RimL family protein N-acetyltransferase